MEVIDTYLAVKLGKIWSEITDETRGVLYPHVALRQLVNYLALVRTKCRELRLVLGTEPSLVLNNESSLYK